MATFINSKGKKVYIRPDNYIKLCEDFAEAQGHPLQKLYMKGKRPSERQYKDYEEKERRYIEDYYYSLPQDERIALSSFSYKGKEAQKQIYVVIDDMRDYYSGIQLLKARVELGEVLYYKPKYEDVNLEYTYGTPFFIAQEETIKTGFAKTEKVYPAMYEVDAREIIEISGNMDNFAVVSGSLDGATYILKFTRIGDTDRVAISAIVTTKGGSK